MKRGQGNHERFCQGVLGVRDATVRGRLYDLSYGFPALVVPGTDVCATGTTDYLADAGKQHRTRIRPGRFSPGWDTVYGQVLTFGDPEERLPALDGLEGFHPRAESFYTRALIPATLAEAGETILVWTYTVESASGVYLPEGRWSG